MKPLVLCILDGVGLRKEKHGNALKMANTPTIDYLWNNYPHSLLEASGEFVGLPKGQMGNSEVGHSNIGAGRIVYQPLEFITKSMQDGSFYNNEKILEVINHTKKNNSKLHIFGLLSDGGIHSHISHLFGLLELCKKQNVDNVYLHMFTDGRDTYPRCSEKYFDLLNEKIKKLGIGTISTISGRYYAMDRDNNFERTKKAYDCIVFGKGEKYDNYQQVIKSNYDKNIDDEFIIPAILDNDGIVNSNDGLIIFNFRPDRLRQLFSALTNKNVNPFEKKQLNNLKLITMMPVSEEVICSNAFKLEALNNTLGVYLSKKNIKQLRIAETEKYAHVTYFFDGGKELKLQNCDRILIPSPKVPTYDLKPEMSAQEITNKLINVIDKYDVVVLNYANGDMVGHTGKLTAAIKSLETLDICLKRLYDKVKELDGVLLIIADHGNCEYMLDDNNNEITTHTTSLVPCILIKSNCELKDGKLSDVAPTILELLNLGKPIEMTGESLIK